MVLFSLVATHADLNLETVARLSKGSADVATDSVFSVSNPGAVQGAVILSTCNRFEVYAEASSAADVPAARESLLGEIAEHSGLDLGLVRESLSTHTGPEVSRHLFSVGAGLDSAVVGEREIAGQVRRALTTAQEDGTASPGLQRLFQAASRTAKEVGTRTALGSRGLSIVSVALDLVSDLSPDNDWSTARVVLFGTGAYAGATMALLRERGCTDISVYSSSGRAEDFVSTRGGTALDEAALQKAIGTADVLIGCSGSDHRVAAHEIASLRQDSTGELMIVDLALTRDFDPEVEDLDGVQLLTLESVRLAAPEEAGSSLLEATSIVAEATSDFEAEQRGRRVDSAIVALRKHTMDVLDSELEKVRARHGCTAAAEEVEFAMRRMVRQLLHIPMVRGRELAAAGQHEHYINAIEALYGLDVSEQAPAAPAGGVGSAPASTTPEASSQQPSESCPVPHEQARHSA